MKKGYKVIIYTQKKKTHPWGYKVCFQERRYDLSFNDIFSNVKSDCNNNDRTFNNVLIEYIHT